MGVFLRHTLDTWEQAADRLTVLDDLARAFVAAEERNKSDAMGQTLLVLTVATAVFLPAQFFAGVYGMNFTNIPELTWTHGYYAFWVAVILWFILTLCYLRFKSLHGRCFRHTRPANGYCCIPATPQQEEECAQTKLTVP